MRDQRKRARVMALLAPVLVLAALASTGATAQAATRTGAAVPSDRGWGPNHDGWHLHITNDTSSPMEYIPNGLNNVYYANPVILPGTTDTGTRGKASIVGGPANMDIAYRTPHSGSISYHVRISAPHKGLVSVVCTSYDRYVGCTVLKDKRDEPIAVWFGPK